MASRSAVKVTKSVQQIASELDQRAKHLEQQLSSLTSGAANSSSKNNSHQQNEQKAQGIRTQLCEIYSDWILFYASSAVQYQVCDRLFRKCFYDRLQPIRMQLTRAHAKQQQQQLKQKQQQQQQQNVAVNQKSLQIMAQLEASLGHQVVEAVTLYNYLCERLKADLAGKTATGAMTQTQSTTNEDDLSCYDDQSTLASASVAPMNQQQRTAAATCPGVVQCLQGLYLSLGDLYRYVNQLQKAEFAYQRSARLGPGIGNPYNQLAVLCQVKDGSPFAAAAVVSNSSGGKQPNNNNNNASNKTNKGSSSGGGELSLGAVAVFWYARSLLATKEAFPTSKGNLARLFQDNQAWLEKQILQQLQHEQLPPTQTQQQSQTSNKVVALPSKSTQSRRFLAQYVDMHRHLYKGIVDSAQFLPILEKVDTSFMDMLQSLGLGESLLCKIITIQAFSEWFQEHPDFSTKNGGGDLSRVRSVTARCARLSTLTVGQTLAFRVLTGLEKAAKQKQPSSSNSNSQQQLPSLRLVTPLLLLTEYFLTNCLTGKDDELNLSVFVENDSNNITKKSTDDGLQQPMALAFCEFWKLLIPIWNMLSDVAPAVAAEVASATATMRSDDSIDINNFGELKEYRSLRGYVPFASFMTPLVENGYLHEEEALSVLEFKDAAAGSSESRSGGGNHSAVTANSSSQVTSGNNSSNNNNSDQGRIKVARMLFIANRLAGDNSSPLGKFFEKDEASGKFFWVEEYAKQFMQQHDVERDDDGDAVMKDGNNDNVLFDTVMQENNLVAEGDGGGDDDDDAGDVVSALFKSPPKAAAAHTPSPMTLVYQPDASGGPALLVPGSLLQATKTSASANASKSKTPIPASKGSDFPSLLANLSPSVPIAVPKITSASATSDSLNATIATSPRALLPPPGFGLPSSPLVAAVGASHAGAALAPPGSCVGFGLPGLEGFGAPGTGGRHEFNQNQERRPPQDGNMTVLESLVLFGGNTKNPGAQMTKNPFAFSENCGGTVNSATADTSDRGGNGFLANHVSYHQSQLPLQQQRNDRTVLESLGIFGGSRSDASLQTKNPFTFPSSNCDPLKGTGASQMIHGNENGGMAAIFSSPWSYEQEIVGAGFAMRDDFVGPEASNALDSGLLSSLLNDGANNNNNNASKSTRNPFAT